MLLKSSRNVAIGESDDVWDAKVVDDDKDATAVKAMVDDDEDDDEESVEDDGKVDDNEVTEGEGDNSATCWWWWCWDGGRGECFFVPFPITSLLPSFIFSLETMSALWSFPSLKEAMT